MGCFAKRSSRRRTLPRMSGGVDEVRVVLRPKVRRRVSGVGSFVVSSILAGVAEAVVGALAGVVIVKLSQHPREGTP